LVSRVIVDQLTPLLPKDSEEVNAQVKRLHAMLDATIMTNLDIHQGGEVRTPTITRARVGTRPVAYRSPWISATKIRVVRIFGTSFVPRMLAAVSRIVPKTKITPIVSTAMRGTMIIMNPYYD
jgi:hypothetical protein